MDKNHEIEKLRERSGNVKDSDIFVSVFYTLIRDGHISPGKMEEIIQDEQKYLCMEKIYTNGWLARYCQDLVKRLRGEIT